VTLSANSVWLEMAKSGGPCRGRLRDTRIKRCGRAVMFYTTDIKLEQPARALRRYLYLSVYVVPTSYNELIAKIIAISRVALGLR